MLHSSFAVILRSIRCSNGANGAEISALPLAGIKSPRRCTEDFLSHVDEELASLTRPIGALRHDVVEETRPSFRRATYRLLPLSGDIVCAVNCLHLDCSYCAYRLCLSLHYVYFILFASGAHRGNYVVRYVFPARRSISGRASGGSPPADERMRPIFAAEVVVLPSRLASLGRTAQPATAPPHGPAERRGEPLRQCRSTVAAYC